MCHSQKHFAVLMSAVPLFLWKAAGCCLDLNDFYNYHLINIASTVCMEQGPCPKGLINNLNFLF